MPHRRGVHRWLGAFHQRKRSHFESDFAASHSDADACNRGANRVRACDYPYAHRPNALNAVSDA